MKLSIGTKITIITVVLLLSTLGFASITLVRAWQAMDSAHTLSDFTRYLTHTNSLLHELQKERGASAGLLAGDETFRSVLNKQRVVTDQAIKQLGEFEQSDSFRALPEQLVVQLKTFFTHLNRRVTIQQNIDSSSISAADAIAYYTGLTNDLLAIIPIILEHNSEAQMGAMLVSYHMYLQMKERAGIERAVVSGALASGVISDQALVKVAGLAKEQQTLYSNYLQYAPVVVSRQSEGLLTDASIQPVEQIRSQVLNRAAESKASNWFELATQRINRIKQGEDILNQHIRQTATDLQQHQYQIMVTQLVLVLLLIVTMSVVALLFVKGLRKGLRELSGTLALSAKNKDLTLRVRYNKQDELGEVAKAYNYMMDEFAAVIISIGDSSHQLASAAEETATTTVGNAQQLERQKIEMQSVVAAIEQMSVSISEVAQQICTVNEEALEVQQLSGEANTAVADSSRGVDELSNEIDSVNQRILSLSSSSERINEVMNVIKTIAEQTNLLALNAAIEAARAGDQGRGFAVVADEVRGLAQRTHQSTGEIEAMVEKFQQDVSHSSHAIEEGRRKAEDSVRLSERVSASLANIFNSVATIHNQAELIASTATQQASVSVEIASSITNLNQGVEAIAQNGEEVARVSEELSRLAQGLNESTQLFKVGA